MKNDAEFQEILKSIGTKIRTFREDHNLTQEELAERTEIEYKYFQRIETGKINMTVKTLFKICKNLNISITDLFSTK